MVPHTGVMTTTATHRIAAPDNGYFIQYERPACGHRFRVTTEYVGWALKHGTPERRKAVRAQLRQEAATIAARPCRQCQDATS